MDPATATIIAAIIAGIASIGVAFIASKGKSNSDSTPQQAIDPYARLGDNWIAASEGMGLSPTATIRITYAFLIPMLFLSLFLCVAGSWVGILGFGSFAAMLLATRFAQVAVQKKTAKNSN